jgi:amidase
VDTVAPTGSPDPAFPHPDLLGPGASAIEIAEAVRSGRVTAREVIAAALDRIEARDGEFHAFTVVRGAEALAEAEAIDAGGPGHDGPLAGVPVAVKEEYDVTGLVTTLGGSGRSTPAAQDSEVIRRLRAAGAVIVGKTAMPEFGQFPITDSVRYGPTRNPWSRSHYPGGSSGGSAAAVAAGLVPIALGADGGGSIRIPAGTCGLVGLNPTRGRVSVAPLSQHWYGLVVLGGLSRTVADSALLLDVIAGSTPTDRWQLDSPDVPFAQAAAADPGVVRVAWTERSVITGQRTDPQVVAALERVVGTLAQVGHDVRHVHPRWPVPTGAFLPQFYAGMATEAGQVEHPELLEPRTRATVKMAGWATPGVVERALRASERVAQTLDDRLLTDADVVALPTMPVLTPRVGVLGRKGSLRAQLAVMPYVANTALANVTGHPAISVPGGLSEQGLPIGIQLIARRGAEGLLLALAAQVERAMPWPTLAP